MVPAHHRFELVAYRFLLDQSLPPVSYLTRLDCFLLGATVLVFVALIQVTVTGAMNDEQHLRRAADINRLSRWRFPTAFVVLVVASFWVQPADLTNVLLRATTALNVPSTLSFPTQCEPC